MRLGKNAPRPSAVPIGQWSKVHTAATYCGATEYRAWWRRFPRQKTEMVVQDWRRDDGATVALCWPMPEISLDWGDLVAAFPGRDAYVQVNQGFWTPRGPELQTVTPNFEEPHEVKWSTVAETLGQPLPFWPFSLRIPELIMGWKPGDETVLYNPTLSINVDETVFPRMAMLYPTGHAAHRTLINCVQAANTHQSSTDTDLLQDRLADGTLSSAHIQLAADNISTPSVELDDVPETVRRDGWRQVLERADKLAIDCVWNTRDLPAPARADFSHSHTIRIPRSQHGQEFLSRLEPTEYRAVFVLLDPDRDSTHFLDPFSDTPVAIDPGGRVRALAPNRLPSFSPLAELVLDGDIWVRTQDGTLYPAPHDDYCGLSWGYGGSGPTTLAVLAERLLDDITATGADFGDPDANSAGLQALMQHDWPTGTVLTRAQLEETRNQ